MVVIGIRDAGKDDLESFFKDLDDRLQRSNIIMNPFRGFCKRIQTDIVNQSIYVLVIKPLYPNPALITLILGGAIFFIAGQKLTGFIVIPIVLFLLSIVMWSPIVYKILIKKMLKKKGLNYHIDFLENEEILRVIFGVEY